MDFAYDIEFEDPAIRRQVKKAPRLGYTGERASKMSDVVECLEDTGGRQEFDHGLNANDLETCQYMLGSAVLRPYVCHASNGDPASARIVLSYPGASAVDDGVTLE